MNVPPTRTSPAEDDPEATQPPAPTEALAPDRSPPDRQSFPLQLATPGGSAPRLSGEVRGLVYVRLREVALLVTIGWGLVLLLCLSGLDGLFNPAHLGAGCIAAVALATAAFLACGVVLRFGAHYPLSWLR